MFLYEWQKIILLRTVYSCFCKIWCKLGGTLTNCGGEINLNLWWLPHHHLLLVFLTLDYWALCPVFGLIHLWFVHILLSPYSEAHQIHQIPHPVKVRKLAVHYTWCFKNSERGPVSPSDSSPVCYWEDWKTRLIWEKSCGSCNDIKLVNELIMNLILSALSPHNSSKCSADPDSGFLIQRCLAKAWKYVCKE